MKKLLKILVSAIVLITILFLARNIYSEYNLEKVISACVFAKKQTSSIEEAKQICADKFKHGLVRKLKIF